MSKLTYETKEDVLAQAKTVLGKTLRNIIPAEKIPKLEDMLTRYGKKRKGFFGDLVEQFVFGLENNGRPEADFQIAGVELKTTPIKNHSKKIYVSKERLVFSMIDYKGIISETWETSSFLKKNSLLLIMFYLYLEDQGILDYEFKFVHLLDLLKDISDRDIEQIRKDWQFIVDKIKRNEAHLLSEGDTYYLGACTKAKNSSVVREQAGTRILAKPRAFSLKQTYLNYLIQSKILGIEEGAESIFKDNDIVSTIEDVVNERFRKYLGKTDVEIKSLLGLSQTREPKSYKRLLANYILTGSGSDKIEELDKANITLRVITLEYTGTLRESVSFPAFDYKDLITQVWYDEDEEKMADFHAQLEMNRFLFVIFQKVKNSKDVVLKKVMFWNFPMTDLPEAEKIFNETINCINQGRYRDMPKMSESEVAHVRPHGLNSNDTLETPQHTREIKRCFWLNAKYIKKSLGI